MMPGPILTLTCLTELGPDSCKKGQDSELAGPRQITLTQLKIRQEAKQRWDVAWSEEQRERRGQGDRQHEKEAGKASFHSLPDGSRKFCKREIMTPSHRGSIDWGQTRMRETVWRASLGRKRTWELEPSSPFQFWGQWTSKLLPLMVGITDGRDNVPWVGKLHISFKNIPTAIKLSTIIMN